jgi:CHAD domain-containing protein
MLEREVKLSVEGGFAPTFPPGRSDVAGIEELPALDLRATYYDTPDLRLARSGVTVRFRTGEDRGRWTVKLPAGEGIADGRDELHFDGEEREVPEAAQDIVRALVRTETLSPVAQLGTRRRRWLLRGKDGGELAELVDDRVSVMDRGRVVERFREIEIEGRGIERDVLERIAAVLTGDGVAPAEQTPKLVRALGARAQLPPDVPVPAPGRPRDPASSAIRAAIAAGVRRVILNDPRTRLGEMEPLHQMRVGTRRLRSDLRTFRPLLDRERAEELRSELKWLGASLGTVRDLDVQIDRLRREAADLAPRLDALFGELEQRREKARDALLSDLRSPRYVELLDRLVAAAANPPVSSAADEASRTALPKLAARSRRRLEKAGGAVGDDSPDEELHQVRVRAKRARYAAEAIAPSLGRKRRRQQLRFAKRAAGLQDVLGELQDSVVASETIERFASERRHKGPLNLASGRMLERERQRSAQARKTFIRAWRRVVKAK